MFMRPPAHSVTMFGIALLMALPISQCAVMKRSGADVKPVYDTKTGKLRELVYDGNHDGKPDAWAFMQGTAVVRIELDLNEDGVVDRWEYYDADRKLQKIGTSSHGDGVVDTWLSTPNPNESRVERSTRRDGKVDWTEFYQKGALQRVEQDVDHDGRTDRWEIYEHGALASVAFDTVHRGKPDQRLVYRTDGSLDHVEAVRPGSRATTSKPSAP